MTKQKQGIKYNKTWTGESEDKNNGSKSVMHCRRENKNEDLTN